MAGQSGLLSQLPINPQSSPLANPQQTATNPVVQTSSVPTPTPTTFVPTDIVKPGQGSPVGGK